MARRLWWAFAGLTAMKEESLRVCQIVTAGEHRQLCTEKSLA